MFRPLDRELERGWVGRIDGERVVHLAAQTLSSFFTGGGTAREHDEYPLAAVELLAPVLHPPAIRLFDADGSFGFANPAAIQGPGAAVARDGRLAVVPRLAAVVGANGSIGGFTVLAEWRDLGLSRPKDRDFALGLGPSLVTADAVRPDGLGALVRVSGAIELTGAFAGFDWGPAARFAADGTELRPGDVIGGPGLGLVDVPESGSVEIEVETLGVLDAVAGDASAQAAPQASSR